MQDGDGLVELHQDRTLMPPLRRSKLLPCCGVACGRSSQIGLIAFPQDWRWRSSTEAVFDLSLLFGPAAVTHQRRRPAHRFAGPPAI